MTNINFNMENFTALAKQVATSSINYGIGIVTTCALSSYEYSKNKLDEAKQKIMPCLPVMVRCAKTAGTLVIAGVAFRALRSLSTHLPVVVDPLAAAAVAGYAFGKPEQCAQALAVFAIGSVVVKRLALSTCSLPMMQALALYFAAIVIANQVAKKD